MKQLEQLIELSRHYGGDSRYVIAGGGNTSYKSADKLWIKASGTSLATITEEGFAVMDRGLLAPMAAKTYSVDPAERERQVKDDLAAACITKDRRPSVETSLHDVMDTPFVVHLHPTAVGALMCSAEAESLTARLFGDSALYVPYTDPGYVLFKKVADALARHKERRGSQPRVILLQNHGIFVGGDTPGEIEATYADVLAKIEAVAAPLPVGEVPVPRSAAQIVPAIRMMLTRDGVLKTLHVTNSPLVEHFLAPENFAQVSRPFTPDIIVYCKSEYVYAGADLAEIEAKIEAYRKKHGHTPKVLMIEGLGLVAAADSAADSRIVADVYTDMLKMAWMASSMGDAHPMTDSQTAFIDNWEVENYRRSVAAASAAGRVENKSIIVTGAAQGFGEGIAECLIRQGANIVVADLNEQAGTKTAARLSALSKASKAIFVKTNVAEPESLDNLIHETVCALGGVDVFVSNAGVLRAGGLEQMTTETFDMVTRINYSAFFYCAKAVVPVMKLQNSYASETFCDIVQINSKSGLRGSKANFAYAGGKFGGVGLVQSFALELAPYRIKVNAVCPGNFYEGPLWADPVNGLFVQYLRAGKVPGAKTVEDVRKFYMAQVPMGKGTNPRDVTKAILYAIEQTCETGQAIPVTGGQVMLN